jgi:hypothetical protein
MSLKFLLLSVFSFVLLSCKQEESIYKNSESKAPLSNLKVSFISIGSGIDNSGVQQLEQLISQFEQKQQVKLVTAVLNWGKEGERDYCIDCSSLSVEKKSELKQSISELFLSRKTIRITSDVPCNQNQK